MLVWMYVYVSMLVCRYAFMIVCMHVYIYTILSMYAGLCVRICAYVCVCVFPFVALTWYYPRSWNWFWAQEMHQIEKCLNHFPRWGGWRGGGRSERRYDGEIEGSMARTWRNAWVRKMGWNVTGGNAKGILKELTNGFCMLLREWRYLVR